MRLDQNSITKASTNNNKSTKKKPSRNTRMKNIKLRNKYGIDIPNSVADARLLDKENGYQLWMSYISKELDALKN